MNEIIGQAVVIGLIVGIAGVMGYYRGVRRRQKEKEIEQTSKNTPL